MFDLGQSALYGTFFLTGLAGSLHCVGMCGPILLAFNKVLGDGSGRWGFFSYHAGRVWTYAMLGLAAGWAGSALRAESAYLGWQRPFSVAVSVLVIASGVAALGWIPGLRLDFVMSDCGARSLGQRRWLSGLFQERRPTARLLLGAVMGLLPCGMVYAMLMVVSSLPNPLASALGMLCFGAGTLPALTAVVLGSRAMPNWLRNQGTRLAAVLLIGIGLFMMARALLVPVEGHMHMH